MDPKSPWKSKTLHFNWSSAVLVHAVWPLLPKSFRDQPYAMSAVVSWFTIGNMVLRFLTTGAVSLWGKNEKEEEGQKAAR